MKPSPWIALLLTGCASYVSPDYYRAIPTPDICQQIWASPAYNVNNLARYAELDRRQTSCGDPPAPQKPAEAKPQ